MVFEGGLFLKGVGLVFEGVWFGFRRGLVLKGVGFSKVVGFSKGFGFGFLVFLRKVLRGFPGVSKRF